MIKRAFALLLVLLALPVLADEKAKPSGPLRPGPEHKKLAYFAGTWSMEGEMKPSPIGPGGKLTATDSCSWFTGGFHLVCKSSAKGAMGSFAGLAIMGYNGDEKVYTYIGINSMGMAESAVGKVDNNIWIYTNKSTLGGKEYSGRYSIDTSNADTYTFKYEISEDGKTWNTVEEGKNTRVKKEAKPGAVSR